MVEISSVYEGMFIIDASRFARDRDGSVREMERLIGDAGGELLVSRLWEERRLAYPIKGHRKGAYWLTYFKISRQNLAELTRQCEISEAILRQLFVRLPESLVDPIVAHAQVTSEKSTAEGATAAKAAPTGTTAAPTGTKAAPTG